MSYDLLRFSLLFRRFVNVKADSELLCALFRESSCTSIHLFRAPPQSNQTHKTNTAPIGANQPNPKTKSVPFCAGFSSASPDATLYSRRPFKTKPLSCGFHRHSDRLLGRLLVDYYYDSSTPTTSLKTPKSKSCGFLGDHCQVPCTGHF